MADKQDRSQLSSLQEAAIGFVGGAVVGLLLFANHIISAPAIAGLAAGIAGASWINAKRRANKD